MALSYNEAKAAVVLAMNSGGIPNLIGHGGIGKTQMVKGIAMEENMNFIGLAANNLKEGELSIPIASQKENIVFYAPSDKIVKAIKLAEQYDKYTKDGGKQYSFKELQEKTLEELKELYKELVSEEDVLEYIETSHYNYIKKLLSSSASKGLGLKQAELEKKTFDELNELYKSLHDGKDIRQKIGKNYYLNKVYQSIPKPKTLFFVDEIGRTAPEVQSELMNFLLEKEINGTRLPDNVYFVTAQNPDSEMPGFQDSMYTSNVMDNAVASRLFPIVLQPDIHMWLQNFATVYNHEKGRQNIHPKVINFVTEKESGENLFNPEKIPTKDFNDTNPRSFEMISNVLYDLDNHTFSSDAEEDKRIKYNAITELFTNKIKSDDGRRFIASLNEADVIPKVEDVLFENDLKTVRKELDTSMIERISDMSKIRQITFKHNVINYLLKNVKIVTDELISISMKALMTGSVESRPMPIRAIVKLHEREDSNDANIQLQEMFYENEDFIETSYAQFKKVSLLDTL